MRLRSQLGGEVGVALLTIITYPDPSPVVSRALPVAHNDHQCSIHAHVAQMLVTGYLL